MPCTVASPSPVPSPTSLVVKKGSKMRSSTPGSIPVPVSLTARRTYSPTVPVSIASVPPDGIASRALIARLTTTCSSCARSASTGGSASAASIAISIVSPISRESIGTRPEATSLTSSSTGSSTWRRAKASSWRVSWLARSAARWISPSSVTPGPAPIRRWAISP